MTNEIDIDAWAPDPPPSEDQLLAVHERAEQMAMASITDAPARPLPASKPAPPSALDQLRAMIFASRSGADPHIVQVTGEGAERHVFCSCKAGIYNLPVGCFAMIWARTIWGLPAQDG